MKDPSGNGMGIAMSILYQNHSDRFKIHISRNNSFSAHLHSQTELIALLEGTLNLTIDHKEYVLTPGSVSVIFPNQLHSLQTPESSKILLCIFDGDFCHSYQNYFQKCNPVSNTVPGSLLSPHSAIAIEGFLSLMSQFPPEGNQIPGQLLALCEGYLTLLLADVFSCLRLEPKNISADLILEQRILMYIDSHYTENISLETLSREFGVSRFSLSRLFSDRFRTTFPCYVNQKRLDYARDMLISTNDSVTRIALDAGFGSSRTFFREFRQAFQTTPREYRFSHSVSQAAVSSPPKKAPRLS